MSGGQLHVYFCMSEFQLCVSPSTNLNLTCKPYVPWSILHRSSSYSYTPTYPHAHSHTYWQGISVVEVIPSKIIPRVNISSGIAITSSLPKWQRFSSLRWVRQSSFLLPSCFNSFLDIRPPCCAQPVATSLSISSLFWLVDEQHTPSRISQRCTESLECTSCCFDSGISAPYWYVVCVVFCELVRVVTSPCCRFFTHWRWSFLQKWWGESKQSSI